MREVERFARQLLVDTFDFVHHAARLDHGHPALVTALAFTHSGFGRLLGDRLVREDADVHLAATLDVAGHGDTSGLDLTGGDPPALECLQAKVAERHGIATFGGTAHTALHGLAEFSSLRRHHGSTSSLRNAR